MSRDNLLHWQELGERATRRGGAARRLLALALACGGAAMLTGCEADSFFDPSQIGRWEYTPTSVPILERIAAIEDDNGEFVEKSAVTADDLIPEVDSYRLAPGDFVEIRIRDFLTIGTEDYFERSIDLRGYLEIPRLGAIKAAGRSETELIEAIKQRIRDERINENPIVNLILRSQRNQTFSVFGAVAQPGLYQIPEPDYRLIEALTAAGGWNETVEEVLVIRQVPLSDRVTGRSSEQAPTRPVNPLLPADGQENPVVPTPPSDRPRPDENLIDLIDELSKPSTPAPPVPPDPGTGTPAGGSPGAWGSKSELRPMGTRTERRAQPVNNRAEPLIDLPDSLSSSPRTAAGQPVAEPLASLSVRRGGWSYAGGRWQKAEQPPVDIPESGNPLAGQSDAGDLVTQRVIAIPMGPLVAGSAEYNIVIRPGDVIRLPPPKTGLVYVAGNVNRPGPYNLPIDGKLTLLRAIDSAGGLSGIAVPERVDLTRIVGQNRQATIRLNMRAIAEMTQPDIYIKPDDRINVGTSFWAFPAAVVRNGFRMTYGFGFLLDRNFADEVFGVTVVN